MKSISITKGGVGMCLILVVVTILKIVQTHSELKKTPPKPNKGYDD